MTGAADGQPLPPARPSPSHRSAAGSGEPAHPVRSTRTPLAAPRAREVGLDFTREWISFFDPADAAHQIRLDITWLCSRWTCIFGRGCHGIVAGRPDDGCCTHGAFFSDPADEKRTLTHARRLTRADWQFYAEGHRATRLDVVEIEQADADADADTGEEGGQRRTRLHGDACIFLNRPGFAAGEGCALHTYALRTGLDPVQTKPEVCWQLPVRREREYLDRPDGTKILVSTITEFDRRGWGEGGHDLSWYCTSSPQAHVGGQAMYLTCAAELTELVGAPAYAELSRLCAARLEAGLVAEHPATTAARGAAGSQISNL